MTPSGAGTDGVDRGREPSDSCAGGPGRGDRWRSRVRTVGPRNPSGTGLVVVTVDSCEGPLESYPSGFDGDSGVNRVSAYTVDVRTADREGRTTSVTVVSYLVDLGCPNGVVIMTIEGVVWTVSLPGFLDGCTDRVSPFGPPSS